MHRVKFYHLDFILVKSTTQKAALSPTPHKQSAKNDAKTRICQREPTFILPKSQSVSADGVAGP
jgi:hypothetical protein